MSRILTDTDGTRFLDISSEEDYIPETVLDNFTQEWNSNAIEGGIEVHPTMTVFRDDRFGEPEFVIHQTNIGEQRSIVSLTKLDAARLVAVLEAAIVGK